MGLKPKTLDREIMFVYAAALGLVVGACLQTNLLGFLIRKQKFADDFFQFYGSTTSVVYDWATTILPIKFLHFFIAKMLQFRYLSPLPAVPMSTSLLFWVVLTHSVSSMTIYTD